MNKIITLLFVFIFCFNTISQTKDEALRDAKKTAKATLNSDYKTVVKHTFLPVIKIMGGKEKALEMISKSMISMKNQGFEFKVADVISVSEIVNEQNQYRCFIKNNYVMNFNGEEITSVSYLLGIYNESKKYWTFIEAKQLANPAMSQVLPNFKTKLIIPQGTMSRKKL
ncbi:hypothetical protein [uncultured Polaribacter sp.]|uniref:hypothetical protein n=1 Tax=uncultured Polaribacter sp. TaxID=174711 RepID=UPI00261E9F53|nr:hypothetical protein [uncultured Polaribacter sp.]